MPVLACSSPSRSTWLQRDVDTTDQVGSAVISEAWMQTKSKARLCASCAFNFLFEQAESCFHVLFRPIEFVGLSFRSANL